MVYNTIMAKKKLSKNEKAAKKAGISTKAYKASKKSSSKKKSGSSSLSDLKKVLKERGTWDSYQKMSPDEQAIIKYRFEVGKEDSKDASKKLAQALEEATKQADPYWKSFLKVAQDEVMRSYDDTMHTAEYQKTELEKNIANISEDLAKNRDFYTLEQQSDLAKLKMSYEQQRDSVITDAAESGLTFSTKREVPLKQIEEYNANVVSATNRDYEKKQADMATSSQRGIDEGNSKLLELERQKQANITDIGRKAESELGTENLPKLEGYDPLGKISGDLYEKKVSDIETRKQAIFNEKNQTSLNFK